MKLYNTELFNRMQKHVKGSYNVPERHFHTMEHLSLGFKDIAEYSSWYIKNISKSDNDIGVNINQIAAWFYHDIHYDAKNPDLNEFESAEIARESLKNIKEIDVDIVVNIIMDTKEHKSTLPQSELILDIDMASLGYDYEKFLYYRAKARNEYELFYNDEQLKVGTIAFLKKTLESDKLYNLDYFKDKYEIQAKNNLFKYLNYLEK